MKKLYSLLLTLLISLLVSSNVFADDKVYMEGHLFYTIENDEITIIKYSGEEDIVEVPISIGGYNVTAIADNSFTGKDIKELILPNTIDSISNNAFDNINDIEIKYYDKSGSFVEKEDQIKPTDFEEDRADKKQTEETIKPSDKDLDNTTVDEIKDDNLIENIDPSKDSSLDVKEGDTIEEHLDMVSEIHVSIGDRTNEEEEEIINIPVHYNNTNSNTNDLNNDTTNKTHSYVYVLVTIGVISLTVYLIKKKTNQ